MTTLLHATDAYLNEFDAEVVEVREGAVVLDRTVFYPTGGGQPHDTGLLGSSDRQWQVIEDRLLPEGIAEIRVVDVQDIDTQADGGLHVANTSEIGRLRISKTENKGRINKRLEIVLE